MNLSNNDINLINLICFNNKYETFLINTNYYIFLQIQLYQSTNVLNLVYHFKYKSIKAKILKYLKFQQFKK